MPAVHVRRLLLAAALLWPVGASAVEVVPPRPAADTIADWSARAAAGDVAAPAHLCTLYFEAGGGTLDPSATVTWCRHAADQANGRALERMGLLTLAGVGTAKDFDAAAALCAQAYAHDPTVAAGFCLAAVAREQRRAGGPVRPSGAAASTEPDADPAGAATIGHWHDLADRGEHAAAANLCAIYFSARDGSFDPATTAAWCRRAAGYGDASAMRRLGLMHLWGVGMEKSAPQAEALCDEAQARDAAISAAFCVAAVRAARGLAAADAQPTQSSYPQPWPAAADLGKLPTALAPDSVLESVHVTATGLRYNCRELIRWSRYGLSVDGQEFGRSVVQYRPQDYASLDAAATDCTAGIAPYDQDGSERQHLAEFRRMIPLLKARQQQLAQQGRATQAENQQRARETTDRNKGFSVMEAFLSATQRQCVDAIHRDWLSRDFSPGSHLLEIRTAATKTVNGDTVVSGNAKVSENTLDDRTVDNVYSCTFAGHSPTIVAKTLMPTSPPQLPKLPDQ